MMQGPPFAVPPQWRQLWESNLDHARSAYGQFIDMLAQTSGVLAKAMPTSEMASGLEAIQQRTVQFAKQNADRYFSFAGELAKAKDIQELLAIQNRYAAPDAGVYASSTGACSTDRRGHRANIKHLHIGAPDYASF
jgi:hypothetical protein